MQHGYQLSKLVLLLIQGERLDLGASITDYSVVMGDDTCQVLDLTSNSLICQPPANEPNPLPDSKFLDGKPYMRVSKLIFIFSVVLGPDYELISR